MQRFEPHRPVIVVLCVLSSWAVASAQVNDNCAGAVALVAGANGPYSNALASNSATLASCGGGGYKDIWFKFTTGLQGTLIVSTGCGGFDTILTAYDACGGTEIACNDDSPGCGFGGSTITFAVGASTYYFRVASYSAGTAGTFTITVTPSTNDGCSGAIALSLGSNGPFSNSGATDSGIVAACAPGYNDVWFSLASATAGMFTVSTGCGGFDTVLSAYGACGSIDLACNDDALGCGNGGSTINLSVGAGSIHYIRVASYTAGTSGSFTITVAIALPPANDECAGAIALAYGTNGSFTNAGATNGGAVASCGAGGYHDVWFSVVAGCSGLLSITAGCGVFDTVMTAYDACGGTELACNDDTPGCTFGGSVLVFSVTSGATYYVRVASFYPLGHPLSVGTFTIDVGPAAQAGVAFTSPLGPGSLQIDISSRQNSGIYVMAVTFIAGNYPNGWLYGIDIPLTELIGQINGGFPFVGTLNSCGRITIGPLAGLGAIAGIPFYSVAFATQIGAAVPDVSAPVTASVP